MYLDKNKIFKDISRNHPLNETTLIETLKKGLDVGLLTKNSDIIYIDIDSESIANKLLEILKIFNALTIRTPRGVLIYFTNHQILI